MSIHDEMYIRTRRAASCFITCDKVGCGTSRSFLSRVIKTAVPFDGQGSSISCIESACFKAVFLSSGAMPPGRETLPALAGAFF